MQLKEVQQLLTRTFDAPGSGVAALTELQASVTRTLEHLKEGNISQAQVMLEHGFTSLLMAFHFLNLDLEKVVEREKQRQKKERSDQQERVILVFGNHAELRVNGEQRGHIPLYGVEDYQELRQIAQLFECRIEHADHVQLDLFALLSQSASG
jgi:hypothetical protein